MSNTGRNYKTVYEFYKKDTKYLHKENFNFNQLNDYDTNLASMNFYPNTSYDNSDINTTVKTTIIAPEPIINNKPKLSIKYELTEGNGTSPDVFGPPFWFTLHNGANKYPENPNKIVQKKMKDFIIAIPVMLQCFKCKDHSTSYIESFLEKLDDIVSSRKNLFNFFVDFHNYVNKKYNKKIYTYEEAYALYNGTVKISKMSYS